MCKRTYLNTQWRRPRFGVNSGFKQHFDRRTVVSAGDFGQAAGLVKAVCLVPARNAYLRKIGNQRQASQVVALTMIPGEKSTGIRLVWFSQAAGRSSSSSNNATMSFMIRFILKSLGE